MRKWWIIGMFVVLAAIALAFRPTAILVEIAPVARGAIAETLDHEGRTRVRDRYAVRAPLAGVVRRITLEAGDAVVAGETALCSIDPPPARLLDARSEEEAHGRVAAASAALAEAGERVRQAEELQRLAEVEFARLRNLEGAGDASARERDLTEQVLRRLEGDARRAIVGVEIAEHELEVARAAFARSFPVGEEGEEAERSLTLRSPIDGQVLRVVRESEGPIAAGEPLLELGDVGALEIVADFLTTDAVRMVSGMPARIHGWGGEELAARVRRVEPSGVTKISALGVEEQRVDVVLDLDQGDAVATLRDGFRVEVSVISWQESDVLRVPEGALFRLEGGWGVFRAENGRARSTAVRIGHRDGYFAEVIEGLRDGETVIVHPPDAVADGSRVR